MENKIKNLVRKASELIRGVPDPKDALHIVTALIACRVAANRADLDLDRQFANVEELADYLSPTLPDIADALLDINGIIHRAKVDGVTDMLRYAQLILQTGIEEVELGWLLHDLHMEASGKKGPPFVQRDLAEFAVDWTSREDIYDTAFCPFGGSFSFAYAYASKGIKAVYIPDMLIERAWARMMSVFCGDRIKVSGTSSIHDHLDALNTHQRFVQGAAFPYWGMKLSQNDLPASSEIIAPHQPASSEALFTQVMLYSVEGRSVVIVPPSFLSRTVTGDKSLKEELLKTGKLAAVVQLASFSLNVTSMPPVMLLLDKRHSCNALAIDASGDHFYFKERFKNHFVGKQALFDAIDGRDKSICHHITIAEAEANDWNLDVLRYVLSDEAWQLQEKLESMRTCSLSDVVKFVRCQALKVDDEGELYQEANQSDIDRVGLFNSPKKQILISDSKVMTRVNRQRMLPGDVLLTVKGNVGKVGLVPKTAENNWIAGQSFIILRLKPNGPIQNSAYLYRYLNSPMAQQALVSKAVGIGTGIRTIKMNDLEELPVIIPTQAQVEEASEKQQQMVSLQEQIAQLQQQIDALRHDDWLTL
ncbi:hypothetical protein NFHSH190041_35390 [Shewanella sp. NFH-SH190041]|uniref:N-6 DNA methylase n=1 Tax=Shewanella sp. NFH-SH190041 TaxID=2950245 RepID=UPI0021C3BF75|nr:N-6 DNA methylase [Shewanella sp. NFH-SH190041]BDM66087.1 hypothetical protein NFHSH190041_35390 [Shewanella sp. NFH-SH190041]